MQYEIYTNTSSAAYRSQLNQLLEETFSLSFEPWFSTWGWPADYTCFSALDHEHVQANVSVYRMDLLFDGVEHEWLQLGAVATREERRGEGLSRRLMEMVYSTFPEANFFLCANASVLDFYPRFGFRHITSWQPVLHSVLVPTKRSGMRKLHLNDPQVRQYLDGARCYSQVLDCTNAAPVNWFHLLMAYTDCLYEIPRLQTMLAARQEGSQLELAGVWASRPVTFADLAPELDFPGVSEIRFGFQPDWLEVEVQMVERKDDPLFVRGSWPVTRPAILPDLIRT
jgi:GNAT superfamily N-acetyltransferase